LLKKSLKILALALAVMLGVIAYNGVSFQKRTNNRPLPPDYKKGVFHLHSVFSDGLGRIEEICLAARSENLDFVILTDHGRPNRQSSAATAWIHDTLLIGASEFSLDAGHMAAAGYKVPGYEFPPEAQEAIDEVERDGGVTFISHPFDGRIPWTDWRVRGFTGIEILSLYQMAKQNLLYGLTLFPLQYLLSPDYALTALISYPHKEMATWDRFNRAGKCFGIYALDTHAKLPISKNASFHFPSYEATFRILNVYVKVDRELEKDPQAAAATIIAALRRGNFFSVIESLAAANGFEAYYLQADGRRVEMGGDARSTGGSLVLKLPFLFSTDVKIRRDGAIFRTFEDNSRQELDVPIEAPGVYRCEISLHAGRFRGLPWILANPIYVARPQAAAAPAALARPRTVLNGAGPYFQVEKNGRSRGGIVLEKEAGGGVITRFAFTLRQESPALADFWTAMARRERLDFSGYQGFIFEASGSRAMRFWLQFRTQEGGQESAFQHSFLVGEEWRRIAIPFERFHRLYGSPPDLAHVSAFFILIDNGNSFSGAQGELRLRPIGLY
jgi:hypothetical protein